MDGDQFDSSDPIAASSAGDSSRLPNGEDQPEGRPEETKLTSVTPGSELTPMLSPHSVVLLRSSSLSREIGGINLIASMSCPSSFHNTNSDPYKSEPLSRAMSDMSVDDDEPETPKQVHAGHQEEEQVAAVKSAAAEASPGIKCCSTPVSKRSHSLIDSTSNSSIRFNASSLISLPYGYYNNTFTKIKAEDVVFPTTFRRKLRMDDPRNAKKFKPMSYEAFMDDTYELEPTLTLTPTSEEPSKQDFAPALKGGRKRSIYSLVVHNEYATNPYKRRYQSVVNERRRLMALDGTLHETADHVTLQGRMPKRPKKRAPKTLDEEAEFEEDSSPEAESADELTKPGPQLPCYSLPALHAEYEAYIAQLEVCNDKIERALLAEMMEVFDFTIPLRQRLHAAVRNGGRRDGDADLLNPERLRELNRRVKEAITRVNNELIALNYAKGMLKTDYANANDETNYDWNIDFTYDVKRLKRLFKHEQYVATYVYSDDYNEEEETGCRTAALVTSPCLTFHNALRCLKGQCPTSKYLYAAGVLTECDSAAGCYLWRGRVQRDEPPLRLGKMGAWTSDPETEYDVMQQNKKNALRAVMEYLNDVCDVAIAEIRIPKPEWGEYTEYSCLNGYCCPKCCTCRAPTSHAKLYATNFAHDQAQDKNANFAVDTKIATMDLVKNVLGSCSCYCKCNAEYVHVMDRALGEHAQPRPPHNEAVSWYEVDTGGLSFDAANKRYANEQVVQERFILRVKLDALPLSWKQRVPFTCKLKIKFKPASGGDAPPKAGTHHRSEEPIAKEAATKAAKADAKAAQTQNEEPFRDFKFINEFTLWDALELVRKEQQELHAALKADAIAGATTCFDALEIDTSYMPAETLELDEESLATDARLDSFVEVALYLPYVPSSILPWELEAVNPAELLAQDAEATEGQDTLGPLADFNVVTEGFKRVMLFMKSWILARNEIIAGEREAYEEHKRDWHEYLEALEDDDIDIFAWGILPVRAVDLPDKFVPLPAGYKHNDVSYPYTNNETTSPYTVEGYGIGDIDFRKQKFSQLESHAEREKAELKAAGSTRQRDAQAARRKAEEPLKPTEPDGTNANTYLVPFFSNLTGPSVRWTRSLIDSLREPLDCIADFDALPIYRLVKCPEKAFYTLENELAYDRRNSVSPEQLLEDEVNFRVAQVWTKSEVKLFVEKYLMYPKNFEKIAQFFEGKKCGDCVEFYYRFKYRLKLKQRLNELRSRIKGKADMARYMRREAFILSALDDVLDDCSTEPVAEFNRRNTLGLNAVSDYLLRCGALDSDRTYHLEFTEHEEPDPNDEDEHLSLDNIAEGYFLPTKYLAMTSRKYVNYPATDDPEDGTYFINRGCFVFDYGQDRGEGAENATENAALVAMNTESFINTRFRGPKRLVISNYERAMNQNGEPLELPAEPLAPELAEGPEEPELPAEAVERAEEDEEPVETPTNTQPPEHGMVTRKKVLSHKRYGYESPTLKLPSKPKPKSSWSKWTVAQREAFDEAVRMHGKDLSGLCTTMARYGKTADQVKYYYHKNQYRHRPQPP